MDEMVQKSHDDALLIQCKDGSIRIEGNSILQNPKEFFKPLRDWVNDYINDPFDKTEVHLKFFYIDTASVQTIFDTLKNLKRIPDNENRVIVNWYFEFDDPELLEIGEIMEGRLGLKFNFVEYTRDQDEV